MVQEVLNNQSISGSQGTTSIKESLFAGAKRSIEWINLGVSKEEFLLATGLNWAAMLAAPYAVSDEYSGYVKVMVVVSALAFSALITPSAARCLQYTVSYADSMKIAGFNLTLRAIAYLFQTYLWGSSADKPSIKSVNIDSSKLMTATTFGVKSRKEFLEEKRDWKTNPPVIGHSPIVPKAMIAGLMKEKEDKNLGNKYKNGGAITNMEGAFHNFFVPVAEVNTLGDYRRQNNKHGVEAFSDGSVRPVLLSAANPPDFENKKVMVQVAGLKDEKIDGEDMGNYGEFPSKDQKKNKKFRDDYDAMLQKHLIYHLTSDHSLPSCSDAKRTTQEIGAAVRFLSRLANGDDDPKEELKNQYVVINGHVLSLEVLFNLYYEQLNAEFLAIEAALGNEYVYTINPPSVFVNEIGKERGAEILNRLQCLAFKKLLEGSAFAKKLHMIGFDNSDDEPMVDLLGKVFEKRNIKVVSRKALFGGDSMSETYSGPEGYALVIHNNPDAFGQNIQFGMPSDSLDGTIGFYSDAACVLKRDREDLLDNLITT